MAAEHRSGTIAPALKSWALTSHRIRTTRSSFIKALRLAADVLAAQTIFVLQRDFGVDHYTTAEDAHLELGKIIDEARGA